MFESADTRRREPGRPAQSWERIFRPDYLSFAGTYQFNPWLQLPDRCCPM